MRKPRNNSTMRGTMSDKEFEEFKKEVTDALLLDMKDAFPEEYQEYLARTTGKKRKLDL